MNYLPFVSWGMYAGSGVTASRRTNFFASWGLMEYLSGALLSVIPVLMQAYRRFRR